MKLNSKLILVIKFVLLAIVLGFIYSIQNCGTFSKISKSDLTFINKLKNENELILNKTISLTKPLSKNLTTVKSILIFNVLNTELMKNKKSIYLPEIFSYHIDPNSLFIETFDVTEKKLKYKFCLRDVEKRELSNLLNVMQVCEPQLLNSETTSVENCDLSYKLPYAKFLFEKEVINLGEKISQCTPAYDICGAHKDSFIKFLEKIIFNIKNKKCQNQNNP